MAHVSVKDAFGQIFKRSNKRNYFPFLITETNHTKLATVFSMVPRWQMLDTKKHRHLVVLVDKPRKSGFNDWTDPGEFVTNRKTANCY